MARTNAPLLALNRGEVSKTALARVDIEKMRLSAECQLNWLPTVVGSMQLRPGLQFVGEVDGDNPGLLLPFVFSKFDTALLELTASKLRIRVNDVLISRVAVATAISDPHFAGGGSWTTGNTTSGASVAIGSGSMVLTCAPIGGLAQAQQVVSVVGADQTVENALRVVIANGPVTLRMGTAAGLSDVIEETVLDTGTHSLAFRTSLTSNYLQIESTDARTKQLTSVSIEPAGIVSLPTPWGVDDLDSIRVDQSGDIIFATAYGIQQYKIERRGTTSWSVVLYRSDSGPFNTFPTRPINMTPSVYYGVGTLTSDRGYFQPGHVGALFRLFSPGQFNQVTVGANNAFSAAVRVTGVGTGARDFNWIIGGVWAGTLTAQRSFDGPTSGFLDYAATSASGTIASQTGTGETPDLDNVIAWERIGFKGGDYVSGGADVHSSFGGGGGYGICRVKQFNSPTVVQIEVLQRFPSLLATQNWVESDWSSLRGWPTSVVFHDGRLAFSGSDRLWASQPDDFTGFAEIDSQGNALGDRGLISETFGSGAVDSVNWMLSLTRLLAGREQQIASIRSSSLEEVLTPTNASTKDCSTRGAARQRALKVDTDGIYVEQSGRVYKLSFNPSKGDYSTRDLTRLNLDIYKPGLVDPAIARQPDTVALFPRGDGQLANLLIEDDDQVECWYRYQTLGLFERACTLPTATGIETAQYFIINRTINGVPRRFIEKLAPRGNCEGGLINQQADCHVVYQGAPATTISLPHLPNTLVVIWADGADRGTATTDATGLLTMPGGAAYSNIVAGLGGEVVTYSGNPANTMAVPAAYEGYTAEVFTERRRVGTLTVAGGLLTLPNGRVESQLVAFFGFTAPFYSAKLAYGAQMGSALGQKKKIDHLGMILYDAHFQGIQMGQSFTRLDDMPALQGEAPIPADTVFDEYDEPMIAVPGTWDTDARLCLLAQAPRPVTVGAVVVAIATNEK
jgi:hypothetical protein